MKKTEYKKIAFGLLLGYAIIHITVGRVAELCGVMLDSSTDVALVYTVLGAYASYCAASASDHLSIARYGFRSELGVDYVREDGTE